MSNLYLVRHGQAAASWDEDFNPGLSPLGISQAQRAADRLASLGPLALITSPLSRAYQTAVPLGEKWNKKPKLEPRVGEIPSPVKKLGQRAQWLETTMQKKWPELPQDLKDWRDHLFEALCEIKTDTVIFTHFVAINTAVGKALGDDRVVVFSPENGSITVLQVENDRISLVEKGKQAATKVM